MADEPRPDDLVRELDVALHGETWARPYSPSVVWLRLLEEVRELVIVKDDVRGIVERHKWY